MLDATAIGLSLIEGILQPPDFVPESRLIGGAFPVFPGQGDRVPRKGRERRTMRKKIWKRGLTGTDFHGIFCTWLVKTNYEPGQQRLFF